MALLAAWLRLGLSAGLHAIAATTWLNPSIRVLDGAVFGAWFLEAVLLGTLVPGAPPRRVTSRHDRLGPPLPPVRTYSWLRRSVRACSLSRGSVSATSRTRSPEDPSLPCSAPSSCRSRCPRGKRDRHDLECRGLDRQGSSTAYCASKAALNNMVVTLTRALAPEIRVNAIAPGFIEGEWLQEGFGENYPKMKELILGKTPLKQVATPSTVAAGILAILAGPDMTTGHVVPHEGGVTISL